MNWAEFVIKRKFTVFAFTIAIILFGIFAFSTLKISLFPETAPPLVNVITAYPGVAAEDVAKNLSKPLEEEFATISGVKNIKSTSQEGLSIVKVEFHYGIDVDEAAVDIQNAIYRIKRSLPSGIQEPQVLKFSSSNKPVITYSLTSAKLDLINIRTLAENEIKNSLQLVDGVAAVDVFGGYKRQINVFIDRDKLNAFNIPLEWVNQAIATQNITSPGGRITQQDKEYLIRIIGEYQNATEISDTVIDSRNGNTVLVKDIAKVEESYEDQRSAYRFSGEKSIAIQIIKKDEANTIEVVEKVSQKIAELKQRYPYLEFVPADDDSIFTKQVVDNMATTVRDALILTTIIIVMFLLTINESFIIALSMPLSLLLTFSLMLFFNMELNLVTLSAIILSVGIVVDDAIIVVENIMRHHHELHEDIWTAAIQGTQEIMLPTAAGSATIVIVMLPLLFLEGFVGRIFGPVAETLIFAIGSSFIVSVTIIPLLTVLFQGKKWNRAEKTLQRVISPFTNFIELLKKGYELVLRRALRFRVITVVLSLIVLVISIVVLASLGMDVLPKLDAGSFFISLQTTPGTSLEKTNKVVNQIEQLLAREKEVLSYSSQIGYEIGGHFLGESGAMGVTQAFITVTLTSRNERDETIWDIEERLRKKIALIPNIETYVVKESGGTAKSSTTAPLDIRISGKDQKVLNYLADEVKKKVAQVPGAVNIYKSWSLNNPEIIVNVNKTRAAQLGLNPAEIARQVVNSIEGSRASTYKVESLKDTDIRVRYNEIDRNSLDDVLNVTLTSPSGLKLPLRDLASIEISPGANVVTRENLQKTIDVLGYTYNRPLSHVINDINKALDGIPVPEGYNIEIMGEMSDLQESKSDLLFSLVLAVISVYLLLVAQFRSFIHPVTIMLSIPLVLVGVALALKISGKSISMPVLLGLILLVGTVVRNGIVLIDYILQARERGIERDTAIIESVKIRFRPIMMTAFSTVAGMLPLALELALGSERFSPLATAVVGGIITSTLLTMVVVPVVYAIFDDMAKVLQSLFISQAEKICKN